MSQDKTLTLIGAVPSPYTRKMVALLRYRHLKFRIIWDDPVVVLKRMKIALPKVALLPTCLMADEAGEMRKLFAILLPLFAALILNSLTGE